MTLLLNHDSGLALGGRCHSGVVPPGRPRAIPLELLSVGRAMGAHALPALRAYHALAVGGEGFPTGDQT
jgi:hypothetical protein